MRRLFPFMTELFMTNKPPGVDRKINVVQMLPDLECGGVEQGTLEMGRFLVEQGHTSIVISADGKMVNQLEREGSTHLPWAVGAKSPRCLASLRPLRRLLGHGNIDILHMRSRLPAWIGFLALIGIPAPRRPVIITTFHGFYSINSYSRVMLKGDCTIAVSDAVKKHIHAEYGVRENIRRIHRGVDAEKFNPAAVSRIRSETLRKKWGLREDIPVILLPGRVSRLKGHCHFLNSLAELKSTPFQAVIVGSYENAGRYLQELKDIINNPALQGHVYFVGHCDDMPAASALADIVVNSTSSKPEAFGRTTVEAMAMAKPVIATAHGGSLETVLHGETGWLVKPSDPGAMGKQLRLALQDPERLLKMGKKGREYVKERFTTHAMCKETLNLYMEYRQRRNSGVYRRTVNACY